MGHADQEQGAQDVQGQQHPAEAGEQAEDEADAARQLDEGLHGAHDGGRRQVEAVPGRRGGGQVRDLGEPVHDEHQPDGDAEQQQGDVGGAGPRLSRHARPSHWDR
jgi:hypothetical protein